MKHPDAKTAFKQMKPLRFGQSSAVRQWEDDQERLEKVKSLYDDGDILVSQKDANDILCDVEEMGSVARDGWLCELDDLATDPESSPKLAAAVETLQKKLGALASKIETVFDP